MVLPIRVIWNLRLPLSQRISIGGIFSVGILCIVMACVRVAQIGEKSNSNSTPSSSWLALWGIAESGLGTSKIYNSPSTVPLYNSFRRAGLTDANALLKYSCHRWLSTIFRFYLPP